MKPHKIAGPRAKQVRKQRAKDRVTSPRIKTLLANLDAEKTALNRALTRYFVPTDNEMQIERHRATIAMIETELATLENKRLEENREEIIRYDLYWTSIVRERELRDRILRGLEVPE